MYRVQIVETFRMASLELAVHARRAAAPAPMVRAVAAAPAVHDERPALPFWSAPREPLPARLTTRPNLYRARRAIDAYSRAMSSR